MRAALAQALFIEPDILLLVCPFIGLVVPALHACPPFAPSSVGLRPFNGVASAAKLGSRASCKMNGWRVMLAG